MQQLTSGDDGSCENADAADYMSHGGSSTGSCPTVTFGGADGSYQPPSIGSSVGAVAHVSHVERDTDGKLLPVANADSAAMTKAGSEHDIISDAAAAGGISSGASGAAERQQWLRGGGGVRGGSEGGPASSGGSSHHTFWTESMGGYEAPSSGASSLRPSAAGAWSSSGGGGWSEGGRGQACAWEGGSGSRGAAGVGMMSEDLALVEAAMNVGSQAISR